MTTKLNKNLLLSFIIYAFFYCLPDISVAQNTSISVQLMLVDMKCLKLTEHGKDEVYFEIKTIDKQSKHKTIRIPTVYPLTLPISKGFTIQNARLLEKEIAPGESITLMITLMESDLSKLNPDDLIGVAQVTMRNNNGQIETEWGIPETRYNPQTTITKRNNQSEYSMVGDGGNYKLIFDVIPVNKTK